MNNNYAVDTSTIARALHFEDNARKKLLAGTLKISAAVKSTLGPYGRTVIIESPSKTKGRHVTKDGVTVAKEVFMADPVENMAAGILKEGSENTAQSAGDGTTTAMVLAEALIAQGFKAFEEKKVNRTEVLRELRDLSETVIDDLDSKSVTLDKEMMTHVAMISANNDEYIGGMVAELYCEAGKDGVVLAAKSKTSETYPEKTTGIKVDRGLTEAKFITNHATDQCVLEDPIVFLSSTTIEDFAQVRHLFEEIVPAERSLLIMAPVSAGFSAFLASNVSKGVLNACIVPPPSVGWRQDELMEDLALALGTRYMSEKSGDSLQQIRMKDLGSANRVTIDRKETIINPIIPELKEDEISAIDARVVELHEARKNAKNKGEKDFIDSRIAKLTGSVTTLYVGGQTDMEHKELMDRVDDSICAVKAAITDGILPGGGVALMDSAKLLKGLNKKGISSERKFALEILYKAMLSPYATILQNADLDPAAIYPEDEKDSKPVGYGFNLVTREHGDMIKLGVTDPTKVTKNALRNAVSCATTILSTDTVITLERM